MGIDPVTHTPRLDLLDISSILRTALANSSLLNLQSFLGAQSLMNPALLKLATALLPLQNENPDLVSENLQQIQGLNSVVQSQVAQQQEQQFSQFQRPVQTNGEDFSGNLTNMSCANSQENSIPLCLDNNFISQQNPIDWMGDLSFLPSLNNMNTNSGYDSVSCTPLSSSSPSPLNSSSFRMNSSAEEDKDSYCSDWFNFEIPESLDIDDFL